MRLEILCACKTDEELCKALGEMKVWQVSLIGLGSEDLIPKDGFCGYTSMDQLRRNRMACNDISTNVGRMEVCETIRQLIQEHGGVVRDGWRDMGFRERNSKERAVGALYELEKNRELALQHQIG